MTERGLNRLLVFTHAGGLVFLLIWLGLSVQAAFEGDGGFFARFGGLGVAFALVYYTINRLVLDAAVRIAALRGDRSLNREARQSLSLVEGINLTVAVLATLQWAFGDLLIAEGAPS